MLSKNKTYKITFKCNNNISKDRVNVLQNKMCEWLSSGEWCDVQLLCGGRTFNAHRAVLASVSSFLRNLLLSCSDESPVLIILPEFDPEAMCSILYYIYKGEVLIQNNKLETFLDTAKAMKIFIDQQYLPQTYQYEKYRPIFKKGGTIIALENYNICYRKLPEVKNNTCYVHLKKDEGTEYLEQAQKSSSNKYFCNSSLQKVYRWREGKDLHTENVISASELQERRFLHDVFKNYSRNGNSEKAEISTTSNENDCATTTIFLAHGNEKHPSVSEILSDKYEGISRGINKNSSKLKAFAQWQHDSYKDSNEVKRIIEPYNHYNVVNNVIPEKGWVGKNFGNTTEEFNFRNIICLTSDCNGTQIKSRHTIAKVTILNKVLQSPWCPQQPKNYRPFRKTNQNYDHTSRNHSDNYLKNKTIINSNDKKNSIAPELKERMKKDDEMISFEQQEHKCEICLKIFVSSKDYDIHMRRHFSATRYRCEECQKTFSQLRNFRYHMSVHRGTKEFATTCPICGKHFNDRGYLGNHMKIHRNRKEYKCAFCPKSFNQRVAFNMHVRIHTGVKPHVCEECGKAFSRKMLLKQHQRTHSGERPYACAHCDRRFADRSNMSLHLRLHTGLKPFSCTLCPKSFTKKHHLKSHLNFHTGLKPYSCPLCKLAFTQSSNMRTHLKKCGKKTN